MREIETEMPVYKLVIATVSDTLTGEVIRWRVKDANENVTYAMLVEHLMDSIEEPTSGYVVSWMGRSDAT